MTLEEKRAYRIGYQNGIKQADKKTKKQTQTQQAVKEPNKQKQNLYIEYLRQSKEVI